MARSSDVTPESIGKIIGVNADFTDKNVQTSYWTLYDRRQTCNLVLLEVDGSESKE